LRGHRNTIRRHSSFTLHRGRSSFIRPLGRRRVLRRGIRISSIREGFCFVKKQQQTFRLFGLWAVWLVGGWLVDDCPIRGGAARGTIDP
jgi:hypothetical protein